MIGPFRKFRKRPDSGSDPEPDSPSTASAPQPVERIAIASAGGAGASTIIRLFGWALAHRRLLDATSSPYVVVQEAEKTEKFNDLARTWLENAPNAGSGGGPEPSAEFSLQLSTRATPIRLELERVSLANLWSASAAGASKRGAEGIAEAIVARHDAFIICRPVDELLSFQADEQLQILTSQLLQAQTAQGRAFRVVVALTHYDMLFALDGPQARRFASTPETAQVFIARLIAERDLLRQGLIQLAQLQALDLPRPVSVTVMPVSAYGFVKHWDCANYDFDTGRMLSTQVAPLATDQAHRQHEQIDIWDPFQIADPILWTLHPDYVAQQAVHFSPAELVEMLWAR